jgi:hypothetical protein
MNTAVVIQIFMRRRIEVENKRDLIKSRCLMNVEVLNVFRSCGHQHVSDFFGIQVDSVLFPLIQGVKRLNTPLPSRLL